MHSESDLRKRNRTFSLRFVPFYERKNEIRLVQIRALLALCSYV